VAKARVQSRTKILSRNNSLPKAPTGIAGLYVAGRTARAQSALRNLEAVCETHLRGKYRIEVADLLVNPQLARGDQIIAVPTLVGLDLRALPKKARP
jgi:hypothetical protein